MVLPVLAQPAPSPATADPNPTTANPFVNSISVTLSAPAAQEIWWSTTGTGNLEPGQGQLYTGPIPIDASVTLRTVAVYNGQGQPAQPANFVYVKDTKPRITINSPPNSSSFPMGGTVNLKATVVDDEGGVVSLDFYRSGGTGGWTKLNGAPLTGPYEFAWTIGGSDPLGSVQLRAIASDSKGLEDTAFISITITEANQPPTVSLGLSPNNPNPIAPANFTLNAIATDDGAVVKVEFFQNGVLIGTDNSGPTWSLPVANLGAGAYSFTAKATDDGALSMTSAPLIVNVAANKIPTVSIISPQTGTSYLAPASFDLVASAADSDGTVARVAFFRGPDSIGAGVAGTGGYTLPITGLAAGSYQYTAKVVDNLGASRVSSAVSVTVANPNRPPVVKITSPGAGTYITPFAANLTATATDSGGSVTKVDFLVNGALERTLTAPPYTYSRNFSTAGNYAIRARATDNAGDTSSAGVSITIVANQKPLAKVAKDTGIVVLPATYTLSGSGSDPENEALTYNWSGPTGVTFNNPGIPNPVATVTAGGAYALKLTVTDAHGMSDDTTMTLYAWTKPTLNGSMNASGQVNSPFSWTVSATGYPAPTLAANNRPAWLAFNAATGVLSGTPTASGIINIGLIASNSAGSDAKTLVLTIADQPSRPTITSPLKDTAYINTSFKYTITATGVPAAFTYSVSTLPAGLALSGADIVGTPTVRGSTNIDITVNNTQGFDKKTLNLLIFMDPKITRDLADTLITIQEKDSITFSFQAQAYPDINAYQWQYSSVSATAGWGNVGTNSETYAIKPTSLASSGWYRAIARNGVGPNVTSRVCRLKVVPIPEPVKISQQPTAQVRTVGERVEFRAKAAGEPLPLYYQWFRGIPPNRRPVTAAPKADDSIFTIAAASVADGDVYSLRVTNASKDTLKAANFAWSDTARLDVHLPQLANPVADPPGKTIRSATPVTLTHTVTSVAITIWYTLDGTLPTAAAPSRIYTGPILIDGTRTLKAIAVAPGYLASEVMSETYYLTPENQAAKPVIKPLDSVFAGTLKVTITSPDGSDILYSLNGGAFAKYPDTGFVISDSTLVKAVSVKSGLLTSDTATKLYAPSKPKLKVLDPQFNPDGGSFSGVLIVKLTCSTPSAVVHYTVNGKDPDSTDPVATERGIPITATTRIKAIGTLKDYANSEIVMRDFRLGPGLITANPHADSIFQGTLRVKLSVTPAEAVIHFSTDATLLPNEVSPVFPPDGLEISNTTTISAIAYLAGAPGRVQTFSYTLAGGPLVTPLATTSQGSYTFKDTTRVSLSSTPGARIYYTMDGTEPLASTAKVYRVPILLDTTTTIQAIAMAEGFENSPMLVATYTLIPEKPGINPPGGAYSLPKSITLTSSSPKASLYYTRNGTTPTAETGIPYKRGASIVIDTPCTIKAVAVAGNMSSEAASEVYTRVRVSDTTLAPGQTLFLDAGYTLRNPENGRAVAQVGIGIPSSLGMPGFNGVLYTLTLSLANVPGNAGLEFPKLAFTKPASEKRYLYKLEPSGMIFFVSSDDTASLGAGTYFMGIDTLPPSIQYTDEGFDPMDSTRVTFEVHDNVAKLNYNLNRNDNPEKKVSGVTVYSDQPVSALLKNPQGTVKPLYVQLVVSDFRNASYFPRDRKIMLPLSQKMKPFQGPAAWKIGAQAKSLYDFVGIPLALDPPLTLEGLRALNPGAKIEAAEFSNADRKFHSAPDTTVLSAGKGFWLAARSPVTSLRMPQASTLPGGGKSVFTVALRTGLNQIANPHLEPLYWPITRGMKDYSSRLVKGLWVWDAGLPKPDYAFSDSLLPWRGYFVQNSGNDTVITLLSQPAVLAAPKAAAGNGIMLTLGWDGRPSLLLGADPAARDAIGIEDEEALPARGDRFLRAERDGRHLATDWVRLDGEGVERWRVEFGSSEDTLPELRVAEASLPEGHEAWALAFSRGMKFRLAPGAGIPASGLPRDSLIVVAGPKERLEALDLMGGLSERAPRLDAKVAAAPEGFRLRLNLPSSARVRATVWSLRGANLGSLATGLLPEGFYDFAFARDFSGRPARLSPGLYALTVEIRGRDVASRLSRKILIAR